MTLDHAQNLVALRRFTEAMSLVAAALASEPENRELLALKAQCEIGLDRPAEALATANRMVAIAPDHPHGHVIASVALQGLDRREEAAAAAEAAVRINPLEWGFHVQLALAATGARGRLLDARAAALRAVELAPNEPDAHFAVGVVAQARTEYDLARQAYRQTLALDPQHANALNNLTVLDGGRSITRSAHGYAESLRNDPHNDVAQHNVAWLAARFVRRIYWAGLAALIVGLLVTEAAGEVTGLTIGIGVVLLVGIAGFAVSLGTAVPAGIRRFVLGRMRSDPYLICCSLLTAVMVGVAALTCLVPGGSDLALTLLRPIGLANVGLVVWTVARASE